LEVDATSMKNTVNHASLARDIKIQQNVHSCWALKLKVEEHGLLLEPSSAPSYLDVSRW
jgi:hypothetical protein